MSNSTKCMLTMMNRSTKPTQKSVQQDGKKKPNAAIKTAAMKSPDPEQLIIKSDIDQPDLVMNRVLDMCLSQQPPKNRLKPTNT